MLLYIKKMLRNKKPKLCYLCNDDMNISNFNKKLCKDCILVKKFIIDYGKLEILNYVRSKSIVSTSKTIIEPSAPKYN